MAIEVAGNRIALFNVDGTCYAIADTCTHRGGPLSEGSLEGSTVTCPWHGAASKGRETERECHHMRFVVTTGPVTNFGCRISGGISAYLTHVVSVFYFFLGSERSIVP